MTTDFSFWAEAKPFHLKLYLLSETPEGNLSCELEGRGLVCLPRNPPPLASSPGIPTSAPLVVRRPQRAWELTVACNDHLPRLKYQ